METIEAIRLVGYLHVEKYFYGGYFRRVSTFGENLKRLRKRSKLRAKDVAKALDVQGPLISKWERGHISLPETPTLFRLAKAIRCSVDELLEGIDPDYDRVRAAVTGIAVASDSADDGVTVDSARLLEERDAARGKLRDVLGEITHVQRTLVELIEQARDVVAPDQSAQADRHPAKGRRDRRRAS